MGITLNADLDRRVHEKLASGLYVSIDHVLSAALQALDQDEQTIAAIAEGYEDFKAGRYEPWDQADVEFRAKHGISRSQ